MIKKVFKTIFILTLCLGTTLPANAGNAQVSDGSAFITKSELSYQLNNLSNRMTQLENSLDSKIDTLVSSYLTRNGIWNGITQALITTNCPFPTPTRLTDPVDVLLYDKETLGTKYEIFKANKSGLAFVQGIYYSNSSSWASHWWGYGLIIHSYSPGKNLFDDSLVAGLFFLDSDNNVKTVYSLEGSRAISNHMNDQASNGRYNLAFSLPKNPYTIISNFFVEKGKSYYLQFRAVVTVGADTVGYVIYRTGDGIYIIQKASVY